MSLTKDKSIEEYQSSMLRMISKLELDSTRSLFLMRLVCLNFFVLFCRPQNWPGLSALGAIRLPMIISIIVILLWLPIYSKSFHKVTKYMMFFLAFEMARGLVGRYFDPADTIVRNDFKQYHTWKDLFLQFTSIAFPLVAVMRSERAMKMLAFTCCLSGVFLGLYTITHAGRGPGGFLGDENDACLVMVMLLPFAVMLRSSFRGMFYWATAVASSVFLCVGIVATNSRGGFLGFAAVLGLFFVQSDKKLLTLSGLALAFFAALPFVPAEYIEEIVSIRTEVKSGGGTVQERFDTWKGATRVFLDPRNTLFGVGMNNVPHWFHEYEDVSRGRFKKSLSGRAMHSIYFTILPDLGLYGIFLIGSIWYFCIVGNWRATKAYERYLKGLQHYASQRSEIAKPSKVDISHTRSVLAARLLKQGRIARSMTRSINVAWVGTLMAGIGVSALYYPPVWFLAGCSAAMQLHLRRFVNSAEGLSEQSEKNSVSVSEGG